MRTFSTVKVITHWHCIDEDCDKYDQDHAVLLTDLYLNGLPICDSCETGMMLSDTTDIDESRS